MYPSGRRNITVIPHLGKIREREQRLTEVLREEFSIDSSTHEDELQVRPTGRGDMLLHTPIHTALTSLPFHPHTHKPLWEQISHDNGKKVRNNVPLMDFIQDHMRRVL